GVEFEDGRCGGTALTDAQLQADLGAAAEHGVLVTVNDEDVVTSIDVHTDCTAQNPLIGEWLRPVGIHQESRCHDHVAGRFHRFLQLALSNTKRDHTQCKRGSCRIFDLSCHSYFPPG